MSVSPLSFFSPLPLFPPFPISLSSYRALRRLHARLPALLDRAALDLHALRRELPARPRRPPRAPPPRTTPPPLGPSTFSPAPSSPPEPASLLPPRATTVGARLPPPPCADLAAGARILGNVVLPGGLFSLLSLRLELSGGAMVGMARIPSILKIAPSGSPRSSSVMAMKKTKRACRDIVVVHQSTVLDSGYTRKSSMESIDDRAVRLTIEAQPSDAAMAPELATSTPFEPQPSAADTTTPRPSGVIARRQAAEDAVPVAAAGPERRLTLLALRLAVLEKAASGLGALGFIWATVVLLGGFAITLGRVDFWSVTAILLVEGGRVFSRSHELEWQHHATWSLSLAARSFRRIVLRPSEFGRKRRVGWPWSGWSWSHLSGHVGRLFYWLQLASATSCVALSAARLARQDFGDALEARTNRRSALDIFYALALVEALLFLAERAAWEWEVGHGRLLERVARDCRLGGAQGILAVRRFFYDAYSRSIEGSVLTPSRAKAVQRALQVLKMLCDTTGTTGTQLRREVAHIVFTFSNIRAVLKLSNVVELRRLGAEVLTRLAMDADARERIGETGGIITILLDMFLSPSSTGDEHDAARKEAGEALAMLALESPRNCDRILKAGGSGAHAATVDRLVDQVVGVGAARVLTHLCAYAGSSSAWFPRLRSATRGAATALRRVASTARDDCRQMEASLGLAAQLVRLMDGPHELAHHLVNARVTESDLVNGLVAVLASYPCGPSIQAPRIRRFAVDLVIALLRLGGRSTFAELMRKAGMCAELRRVAETTSELECFHVFSGSAGVGRHAVGLAELVDAALQIMGDDDVAANKPHV
ncbi:hypothetical protein PR202_ga12287 [Eleusine coracana subsp. coracana]|uniref:ARM repeat superfamily protein n=1 Tax=Eleusine coracana subsp. coracana TaxID=191504 RepID=A0AAV5CBR1_ELECO|nr:hypothetical protein PR202_ga12287 [Eleusine coracana subsp. coracana]